MKWIFTLTLLFLASLNTSASEDHNFITLSSTTSTDNSGLLEYLIPKFKNKTGIDVRVIAVGTGRALLLAERGDADLVLVHHKPSEENFVAQGFGVDRRDVMYNDYVIVGPKHDPAKIKNIKKAVDAFKLISQTGSPFVSRGDDSGTHKKELELWKLTGVEINQYSGDWYRESGSGMGATLNIANGMLAYTLSDRGTWISFKNRNDLTLLYANDPPLFNQYGITLVNPERHEHIKFKQAKQFSDWLTSQEGQQAISEFTLEGQQLFFPNAQREIATVESK